MCVCGFVYCLNAYPVCLKQSKSHDFVFQSNSDGPELLFSIEKGQTKRDKFLLSILTVKGQKILKVQLVPVIRIDQVF